MTMIKHMRILKNKKVVHLFTQNSASFLYQINQWILYYEYSSEYPNFNTHTKRRKGIFSSFIKAIFNKLLISLLHIAKYTLFYKKLIYKKLGLAWFKTQEASRTAISFLIKCSYVEN